MHEKGAKPAPYAATAGRPGTDGVRRSAVRRRQSLRALLCRRCRVLVASRRNAMPESAGEPRCTVEVCLRSIRVLRQGLIVVQVANF